MLGSRVRTVRPLTLFTLLLSRVRVSPSQSRPLRASTIVHRRDIREEMGNQASNKSNDPTYSAKEAPAPELKFSEEELKSRLTAEEYHVTQEKGTERAWSGRYVSTKEPGVFNCVVCDTELFRSDKKFESGSGWPSFSEVAKNGNVMRIVDDSHGMVRTEVVCGKCGAHLGHVFDDGPQEDTGLRYCINSVSLKFKSKDKGSKDKSSNEEPPSEENTSSSPPNDNQSTN